ncbi:hypothetical protein F2Q68_00021161 [Brassica cretica]|uniref:Uncharacterized protein n=1 Tax=Brassica cretica TaxID=69181 RepID=A0A8S9FXX6_BRACR|nr:hypothetical protein F2Q68_00021161 [Brassica cretica]
MFRLEYRSMSNGRCRSTEEECLRLTVVSECRSAKLVFGSTVVDENRATNCCCCRSMKCVFLCGLNVPNLQGLMRITVEIPCCFWFVSKVIARSIDWGFELKTYKQATSLSLSRVRCKLSLMSTIPRESSRSRDDLEECGDFGVFWSLLSAELHRRVRCLAMDGDLLTVNQHPVADVMPVLLKSGQSASREEVVEEMKNCRSMKQHWCRSTVMPEYGLSIFYGRLKPRSNHILPEYSCMT